MPSPHAATIMFWAQRPASNSWACVCAITTVAAERAMNFPKGLRAARASIMSHYMPPGPGTAAIFADAGVPKDFILITPPKPRKGFRLDPGLGAGPGPPSLSPGSEEIVLHFFLWNLRRVPPCVRKPLVNVSCPVGVRASLRVQRRCCQLDDSW